MLYRRYMSAELIEKVRPPVPGAAGAKSGRRYCGLPRGSACYLTRQSFRFRLPHCQSERAGTIIGGCGAVVYNIQQVSLRQAITPERMQGRMNSVMRFLVWGPIPLDSDEPATQEL